MLHVAVQKLAQFVWRADDDDDFQRKENRKTGRRKITFSFSIVYLFAY